LNFDNTFSRLPEAFFTRRMPEGLPNAALSAVSDEAAELIGLAASFFVEESSSPAPKAADIFAGNTILPGMEPLAAVYSGHQFGVWAGQLGDGRAHLLGEISGPNGHWEVQLKGAGRTPYSRMGDGRAVLRSSIREFLCSEAMAGLGIPTTRALCLVTSPLMARRERMESCAVVTRMAPSFVRFGSFEHWSARDDRQQLKTLLEYVVAHDMPHLAMSTSSTAQLALALLGEVSRRTAELLAQWQSVGFMHGVMNTDNMSILGLTLDYGPFGFMEAFDATHVCNHSDHQGRYAYHAQPQIAYWNLYALGSALMPLVDDEEAIRDVIDGAYLQPYRRAFKRRMLEKLGLNVAHDHDDTFINDMFRMLQEQRPDYTLFFRALSNAETEPGQSDAAVRGLFIEREACDAWLSQWRARLQVEDSAQADRQTRMTAVNPKFILRNYLAEQAIKAASEGDFSEIESLLKCLRLPYDEQAHFERYAALPPDWASGLEVSCSS
jgi:uncharacterized protein YdiU (UPF0061 family)